MHYQSKREDKKIINIINRNKTPLQHVLVLRISEIHTSHNILKHDETSGYYDIRNDFILASHMLQQYGLTSPNFDTKL